MKHNPFKIVQMFEEEVADYTGAPYAVAVDNCTDAIFLCCVYNKVTEITIPRKTYLSIPQSIVQSGANLKFEDIKWKGLYQLKPYPIYDSAKRFTSNMYIPGSYMCLSFHPKKILKMRKGGMILTDNYEAYKWFKQARHEGRQEIPYQHDNIKMFGWNMYMSPPDAAEGLWLMFGMPKHNEDLLEDYTDLAQHDIFQQYDK